MLFRALVILAGTVVPLSAATIAIRDVTVIDGTGASAKPKSTVIVRDERITHIGPAVKVPIPKGARVIEGRGRYVIPGLWDMHVHLWYEQNQLPIYVAHGITGVRDMGSDFKRTIAWRRAAESGQIAGPHVVTSGPAVDGRISSDAKLPVMVATSAEDGRRTFDRLDDMDVDFVKVLSGLPRDSYIALAERARKWRLPFSGHIPSAITAQEAIDARQASIEHLFGLFVACSSQEEGIRSGAVPAARVVETFDVGKARDLFRKSALMETRHVPTLTLWERIAYVEAEKRVRDPRLRYVPAVARASWPKADEELGRASREDATALRKQFELALQMVKLMQESGVEIMAGTDTGDPYTAPGVTLHRELELLVKAGLTPMQALQAATLIPTRFLGWDESVGVLRAGMVADMVLLDANPLADIRNVSRVSGVLVRGRYWGKAWIQATLAAVK